MTISKKWKTRVWVKYAFIGPILRPAQAMGSMKRLVSLRSISTSRLTRPHSLARQPLRRSRRVNLLRLSRRFISLSRSSTLSLHPPPHRSSTFSLHRLRINMTPSLRARSRCLPRSRSGANLLITHQTKRQPRLPNLRRNDRASRKP